MENEILEKLENLETFEKLEIAYDLLNQVDNETDFNAENDNDVFYKVLLNQSQSRLNKILKYYREA